MNIDDAILSLVSGNENMLTAADLLAGDDPLVGYDDPLVGAALALSPKSNGVSPNIFSQGNQPMLQKLVQLKQAQNARNRERVASLSHTGQQPCFYLGVDSVANVAAAANFAIQVTPVKPIRVVQFTVDQSAVGIFIITSVMMGNENLLLNAMAIPCSRFTPDANRPPLKSPIIPAGTPIFVNGTNISGAAARFLGSFDVVDLSPACC